MAIGQHVHVVHWYCGYLFLHILILHKLCKYKNGLKQFWCIIYQKIVKNTKCRFHMMSSTTVKILKIFGLGLVIIFIMSCFQMILFYCLVYVCKKKKMAITTSQSPRQTRHFQMSWFVWPKQKWFKQLIDYQLLINFHLFHWLIDMV